MKEGWEVTTIGAKFKTSSGGTPNKIHKEYYEDGDIPWLRSGEVCEKYISKTEMYITQEGLNNSSAKWFPERTVVVAMYGATAGQVGILGIPTTTNQAICGIFPNKNFLPEFVYYAILCQQTDLVAQAVGNAQPNISQDKIKKVRIPNLSLPEQERIVSILDAEFAKIDAVKAGAEKSLQHAKDLFQAALKKELTPKEGWETKKLKEVAEICLGLTHTPQYVEKGVPFVSVKDISGGVLDLSKTKKISKEEFENFPYGAKPNKGDVLFCRVGTLGKPLVLALEEPFGIFVSVGFLRPNRNIIHPEILRFWMLSSMFDSQVNANVVGSTLKNLNTGWLKNFIVSIPPMIEQVTVIDNLFRIEKNCKTLQANYERTIALCDDMKQALLRKAFNGEL